MRLDNGDHPALHAFARGGEHGADLDRVMAVIVDHGGNTRADRDLAHLGEAPLDPAELGEAGGDDVLRTAHLDRHGHGGQRVLHVVPARHGQFDALDPAGRAIAPANGNVEAVAAGKRRHILTAHVGLRGKAVSDHAPVAHLGNARRLHFGVVDAEHHAAP